MTTTIKFVRSVSMFCILSPALCWANLNYDSIYNEILENRAVLIDARQDVQLGQLSVKGSYWVRWPQTTQELPKLFDQLSSCLNGKRVYVFCYVGSWAGFVKDQFDSRGIDAVNTGGYSNWELSGVPMTELSNLDLLHQCNGW